MSSRLKVLNRLAALYELVEQMQAISLDRAAAELREAETRVAEQAAWVETAGQHAREALHQGDRPEWLMNESEREFAVWNGVRLEALRARREELKEMTAELYRKSLLDRDQIDTVVKNALSAREAEMIRREQASADDRHMSRLRWLAQREAARMKRS
jgi:hypothetical protein